MKTGQQHKTVWITGASSGIGEALARQLDAEGYHVIITARSADKLESLADQGKAITALPGDICNPEDLNRFRAFFSTHPLDTLILNAGTCHYMEEANLNIKTMRNQYDLNLFAAAECIDVCKPALKRSGNGHIVAVSSMSVYLPFPRAEYYASSKCALDHYLQCLELDLLKDKIDITRVYPGFVKTSLTDKNTFPMPFLITAEQAAKSFLPVLKQRPATAAFPKRLHYLLQTINKTPVFGHWLWKSMWKHQASKDTHQALDH